MSVTINGKIISSKSSANSNVLEWTGTAFGKDDKTKINHSKIANGCNYNVDNLGIDKMVILVPINTPDNKKYAKKVLTDYPKVIGFTPIFKKKIKLAGKNGTHKNIYKRKWRSTMVKHFYLELDPIFSDVPYMRLTLNPSKMGAEGIATFKHQLNNIIPGGYYRVLLSGRVSYMEICFDAFANKKDLSFYCKRVHSTMTYGLEGMDGTIYFGKKSSSSSFKCYNRKKKLYRVEKEIAQEDYLTRLEAVVKHFPLSDLPKLNNPLTRLSVFETAKMQIDKAVGNKEAFLQIMQNDSVFAALKSLSHYRRKKALKGFSKAIPSWWEPTTIWANQWSNLLKQYGIHLPCEEYSPIAMSHEMYLGFMKTAV